MDELNNKIQELSEKVQTLEKVLYDEILSPVHDLFDSRKKDERKSAFKEKYNEQLTPYVEDYRKLYGDDLDLFDDSFNEWDKLEDGDKDNYIVKIIETITSDRDRMKEKFGKQEPEVKVEEPKDENKSDIEELEDIAKMLKKYRG